GRTLAPHPFPTRRSSDLIDPDEWRRWFRVDLGEVRRVYQSADCTERMARWCRYAQEPHGPTPLMSSCSMWPASSCSARAAAKSSDRKSTRLNSSHVKISY